MNRHPRFFAIQALHFVWPILLRFRVEEMYLWSMALLSSLPETLHKSLKRAANGDSEGP